MKLFMISISFSLGFFLLRFFLAYYWEEDPSSLVVLETVSKS